MTVYTSTKMFFYNDYEDLEIFFSFFNLHLKNTQKIYFNYVNNFKGDVVLPDIKFIMYDDLAYLNFLTTLFQTIDHSFYITIEHIMITRKVNRSFGNRICIDVVRNIFEHRQAR